MYRKNIKILFVGDTTYEIYVKAFYNAAKNIEGVEPYIFDFGSMALSKTRDNIIKRIEFRYRKGIYVGAINKQLILYCKNIEPDIVFLYSAVLISVHTLRRIKELGVYLAMYCNDDPFSKEYSNRFWKNIRDSALIADKVYAYRSSNIQSYMQLGAGQVSLLLPYYIKERNFYIEGCPYPNVPPVVYIGHNEEDGREGYIKRLLDAGIKVGLNDQWVHLASKYKNLTIVSGDLRDYNKILNSAEIAIVFLSKRNNDTYTRRCFEIPATKAMMIAPYTDDLSHMFTENIEAVYYRNEDDFLEKVIRYMKNKEKRKWIGEHGYNRLMKDGHEARDRVKQVLNDYFKLNNYNLS